MSTMATESDGPSTSSRRTSKPAKNKLTKTIIIKLSPSLLRDFPHDPPSENAASEQAPVIVTTSAEKVELDASPDDKDSPNGDAKVNEAASTPNPSEANGDTSLAPSISNGVKRKGAPSSKSDTKKQPAGLDENGNPKPRGKPGPKKRRGLDGDSGGKGMWTAPPASHKLGPKANQGDINARRRALDRNGPPCRKWHRQGLNLTSFNGIKWDLGSWKAPPKEPSVLNGDGKSEATGSSDAKQEPASSNLASEKSQEEGADINIPHASTADITSSPAPRPADNNVVVEA